MIWILLFMLFIQNRQTQLFKNIYKKKNNNNYCLVQVAAIKIFFSERTQSPFNRTVENRHHRPNLICFYICLLDLVEFSLLTVFF